MVKSFPDWLVEKAVAFVIKHLKNLDPDVQKKVKEALEEEAQKLNCYSQNQEFDWNYNTLVNKLQGSLPKIRNCIAEQGQFHYVPGIYPSVHQQQQPCCTQNYVMPPSPSPHTYPYYHYSNQYSSPCTQNVRPPYIQTSQSGEPFNIAPYVMKPNFSTYNDASWSKNDVVHQSVPIPIVDLNTKTHMYSSSPCDQYVSSSHSRRNSYDGNNGTWDYHKRTSSRERYWRLDDKSKYDDQDNERNDYPSHHHHHHRKSSNADDMFVNENYDHMQYELHHSNSSSYKTKPSCLKRERSSSSKVNYPGLPIGAHLPSNFD